MKQMDAMALVVLGLAGYRLTRLLVLDTILDGPRGWVLHQLACPPEGTTRATSPTVLGPTNRRRPRGRALRAKLAELLQCTYCVGVWVMLGLAAWWHWAPQARWAVFVAAAMGLQALLNGWDQG